MKQTEFIKKYCKESNITENQLNKLGQFAVRCECGWEDCEGWAILRKEDLATHLKLYLK